MMSQSSSFHTDQPTSNSKKATADQLTQNLELLRIVLLIFVVSSSSTALLGFGFLAFSANLTALAVGIVATLVAAIYLTAYLIAQPKNPTEVRYKLASYILLTNLLVALSLGQLLLGTGGVLTASFILIPILGGIVRLGFRQVTVFLVLALCSFAVFYLMERIFLFYKPGLPIVNYPIIDLPFWIITFILIGSCVLIFIARLQKTNLNLIAQGAELSQTLAALQFSFDRNAALSRELSSATNELSATAEQQSTGTQEQVAAVTEVTSSLEELGETASQIAGSALSVASSARQMIEIARRVNDVGDDAQTIAEQGIEAVKQALGGVSQVRDRIELMGQRLLNLTQQNHKVTSIIEIIDEIADETHLLSLNASIEAAGGITLSEVGVSSNGRGTMDSVMMRSAIRGERFGVISQEIKNLSERSRESTEEVRQAISEMQGAVAAAVLVAEEGKKASAEAMTRAEIAGVVIDRLYSVITDLTSQFEQVLTASQRVGERCEEIRVATSQQKSANVQIVQTMRSVSEIARQSASIVTQISETINRVNLSANDLSIDLNHLRPALA